MRWLLFFLPILVAATGFDWERHSRLERRQEYFKEKKEHKLAAEHYEELLQIDPENRDYLLGAASNYAKAGNYEKAEYWYMMTLHIYPDDLVTQLDLGQLYMAEGDYEQAEMIGQHVLQEDSENLRALILLMRVALLRGDDKAADEYLAQLQVIDPSAPSVIQATTTYHISKGDYKAAYDQLIDAYALSTEEEIALPLWGIRPYVKPSLECSLLWAQEREEDLTLKIKTTQIDTWLSQFNGTFPLSNTFRLKLRGTYGPQRQHNLLTSDNNYQVDVSSFAAGFVVDLQPSWKITAMTNQKWGSNVGDNAFPFPSSFLWEPSVSLEFASPHSLFSMTAFKDSFIGRDFNSTEAFFVTRQMMRAQVELRTDKNFSRLGGIGAVGFYGGKGFDNLKREGELFAIADWREGNLHNLFEYRFTYGNFWAIDPDYYSYRGRWQQIGRYKMLKIIPGKGEVSWGYEFMRQTLRDFSTDSDAIVGQPQPGVPLRHNVMNAHTFTLDFSFIMADLVEFLFSGRYYFDTNDYTAGLLRGDLRIQF